MSYKIHFLSVAYMILKSLQYRVQIYSEPGIYQYSLVSGRRDVTGRKKSRMSTVVVLIYITRINLYKNEQSAGLWGEMYDYSSFVLLGMFTQSDLSGELLEIP